MDLILTSPTCGPATRARASYGHTSSGVSHRTRSCDARCMGAIGADCSCACGGRNHGMWNLLKHDSKGIFSQAIDSSLPMAAKQPELGDDARMVS